VPSTSHPLRSMVFTQPQKGGSRTHAHPQPERFAQLLHIQRGV